MDGFVKMEGVSKETQMSLAASSMFPGFRFSPTDVELISYYLKKKLEGCEKFVEVISEVEICKFEPWDLPAQSIMQSDNEWFFFAARGKKYPNGSQSRRATELGYWKATGKERNVKSGPEVIGTKRTLVFHIGRAPKGERTEWIMHEYCMSGAPQDSLVVCRLRRNSEFRLNNPSNRAHSSQGDSHIMYPSSAGLSDGHQADCHKEGDHKAVDGNMKKSSCSYDSHSIEQLDSASDSSQQVMKDCPLADSSSQQEDCYGVDDFYADILKDDIIKLDDSSTSATRLLPAVANKSEEARKTPQPIQAVALPLQGFANRRIRLNRLAPPRKETRLLEWSTDDYKTKTINVSAGKESPICLDKKSLAMTVKRHLRAVVSVLTLLLFIHFMSSNLPLFKKIAHSTLCKKLNAEC